MSHQMILMRSVADARPPQRFQCHRSAWAGTGQVGHLQPGGSSAVSERPPLTTTWRVILWLTWVLSGRDMRGSGKKRASLRRVWTRRDAHIRPLCWQPIPHCNDNSCPSVRPRPCAGINLPIEALMKPVGVPACQTIHLKPSRTDFWLL